MVFKPMKRTEVVAALQSNDCTPLRNTGGHEIYGCPCGQHRAPVPNHRDITAGVVKSIGKQMTCLQEGWLH